MRTRDPAKEQAVKSKALALVVKHGFDGFSMHKLAKAAKVSPATLYIYFKDREDLILSLYVEETAKMAAVTLEGFSSDMPFAQGLRIQWFNRARYCLEHPLAMHFLEQVKFSPLHEKAMKRSGDAFAQVMRAFVQNAIRRGELVPVPVEIYWSVAFAPLYQLVKYHMSGFSLPGRPKFTLEETALDTSLALVLKALTPTISSKPIRGSHVLTTA